MAPEAGLRTSKIHHSPCIENTPEKLGSIDKAVGHWKVLVLTATHSAGLFLLLASRPSFANRTAFSIIAVRGQGDDRGYSLWDGDLLAGPGRAGSWEGRSCQTRWAEGGWEEGPEMMRLSPPPPSLPGQ